MKLATDAQHCANSGVHCPRCNSTNLDGGPIDIDNAEAWQDITCTDCNATWTDIYTLSGYCYFDGDPA